MKKTDRYDSLFIYYARQSPLLSGRLLKAQAMQESGMNPEAKSPANAYGLCQFLKSTFVEVMAPEGGQILNPEDSIKAQVKYMNMLMERYDDNVEYALMAYNWGMGNVEKLMAGKDVKVPKETQEYVKQIAKYYKEFGGKQIKVLLDLLKTKPPVKIPVKKSAGNSNA